MRALRVSLEIKRRWPNAVLLLLAACFYRAGEAQGANITWDGNVLPPTAPNGVYDVPLNWNPNQLPLATDTAVFDRSATYTVTFDSNESTGGMLVDAGSVTFASNNTTQRTFSLTGTLPLLQVRNGTIMTIGYDDPAAARPMFVNVAGQFFIGTSGPSGRIVVSGAGSRFDVTGGLVHKVGDNGGDGFLSFLSQSTGTIGGTLDIGVANSSGTSSFLTLDDADVTVGNLRIGTVTSGGRGEVTVRNGATLTQSGNATLTLGASAGDLSDIEIFNDGVVSTGTGTITINPTGRLIIGADGNGTFNANGNVAVNGGLISVDTQAGDMFNLAAGKTFTATNKAMIEFQQFITHFGDNTTWNFQSEALMNVKSLRIASNGGPNNVATVTITGVGDIFTPTGIQAASGVTIGHASDGAAVVNVSNVGGLGSAGNMLIQKTGTVNINANGILGASGNLTINGGKINGMDGLLLASGIVTASSEAQINMQFANGNLSIDVPWMIQTGADVTSNAPIVIVTADSSKVIIDGTGSTLTSTAGNSQWGDFDKIADVTFRNNATGNVHGLILADETPSGSFLTSKGIVRVESSADMSVGGVLKIGVGGASTSGAITVSGLGSTVTQTGSEGLTLGHPLAGSGTINVLGDGVFTTGTGPVAINATGTVNVDGGTFNVNGPVTNNGGTVNFTAGAINVTGDLTLGAAGLLRKNTTLTRDHALSITGTTTIEPSRNLTIDGSQFSTGALAGGGSLDFRRGTVSITGPAGLAIGPAGPLGSAVSLGAGQTLNVTNTATVQGGASLLIETGGTLNAATLANNGNVTLDGINATLGGGMINNAGVLRGDGRVTAAVNNLAAGEIRAELGRTLRFTGMPVSNNARMTLQGGALQFGQAFTNAASGVISGRGALFFDGGLTNQGKMQFSGGPTDIYGNVSFTSGAGGGELINSGGANVVTFYGNVTHNGDEIRTSPTNTTVFFGDVSGAGPFTGTGAVRFEGAFSPGNSPAIINMGGNVEFGPSAAFEIEIGGLTPGTQHDRINIAGQATLNGALELSLINGFVPSPGDSFTIMTFGSRSGTFSQIVQPTMAQFNAIYSATDLVLVAVLPTGEKVWALDANGNTSVGSNWTGGVAPGGIGDTAVFGSVITAPRNVTVDAPLTLGRLDFNNANTYTVAGANAITLDVVVGIAQINVINGSHAVSAPVTLTDDAVINIAPAASKLSLSGTFAASGRAVTKNGAGTLTVNDIRAAALTVNGGEVIVAANGAAAGTSVLNTLTLAGATGAWTSKFDVSNNDSVFQSTAANKAADFGRLYNQLRQGFNAGDWLGLGITSGSASTNPSADTGLSLVDNALLGYTDFSGQAVTSDSILLKYTYYGDIDQNGQVDADDLTVFGNNFGRTSGATQVDGDIDFNGTVDADDLTVFGNNFNKGIGNPLSTQSIQAVPEPSTLTVLLVATLCVAMQSRPHRGAYRRRSP
jgi:hypothetical protein